MADEDTNVNMMDYAFNKQPIKFQNAFNDAMNDRIKDVLAAKHDEVASQVYNQWNGDEVDDITVDELEAEIDSLDLNPDIDDDQEPEEELTPEEEQELDNDEDI